MDVSLTEEQRAWQAKARRFAQEELRPTSLERDRIADPRETFDWEIIKKGSRLGLPVNSVKELVAYGKSKPNALSYGSAGIGGAGHLARELFRSLAGIRMVHVPYKGGGLVLSDMISGQIQLGFTAGNDNQLR